MKLSVVLKGHVDQFGRQPLQIKIENRGRRSFVPLHIKVAPAEWDKNCGEVLKTNPQYKELNRRIRLKVAQVENGMRQEETPDAPHL